MPLDDDATFQTLFEIATETLAHVTLHATFGREAVRHPFPDWTCQIAWGAQSPLALTPQSFFGTGGSPDEAAAHVLRQIEETYPAEDAPDEPTHDTPQEQP